MSKSVILCVDDEKTVLNGLRDELKFDFGSEYSIELAESGEEALALIEDLLSQGLSLPVVVSDQIMPGMKGDELLIAVHQRLPYTRKILLTGQASPESVGNLVNNGALYRYMAKPWEPKDLTQIIREAIEEYTYDLAHKDDEQVYARRIQQALLMEPEVLRGHFPESFIYYQPAATVAGDFYWFGQREEELYLCVADATGRGIPGAYLSALGVSSLNYLLHYGNNYTTAEIVQGLDRRIAPQLSEIRLAKAVFDGLEVGLCRFRPEEGLLEFTGANIDLHIIRGGQLTVLQGHATAVARDRAEGGPAPVEFQTQHHELKAGDQIYLFTDGLAQQPGTEGRVLARKRLLDLLLEWSVLPMADQRERLKTFMATWQGSHEQRDDFLLVGLKV
ncbi:MAG: fused response regulator/phosphatase [Bacteroidia bacterium]|nr:fused response regulator/phosphatase [Bacteroidia bacterium]